MDRPDHLHKALTAPCLVEASVKEQIHPACRSVDAHTRANEYLLIKRGSDKADAPNAARDIYQRYPWMVMDSRNKYFDDLPFGGSYEAHGNAHTMTPKEHATLVENGLRAICGGLESD